MKQIVCTVCPNGCALNVERDGEEIKVSGNKCKRGENFAVSELIKPMRTICSTVKTNRADIPVVPVRVSSEIPKEKIFAVMNEINSVTVSAPLKRGDTVIENVLGLGVDVIATSGILSAGKGGETI